MNDRSTSARQTTRYQVRVGHATVIVDAVSEIDAIRMARKKLSHEMPRLWDVIHRLDDRQFCVDPGHV